MAQHEGRLLSRSATTGWLDCMHGELWLFPDGLLRIPMGWGKTVLMLGYYFGPRRAQPRVFSDDERAALITHRRTMWIPFAEVQRARLRHSMGADELVATLADGRQKQLLWIPNSVVFVTLQQLLTQVLGSQLSTRRDLAIVLPPWLDDDLYIGELEIVHAMILHLPDILAVILYGAAVHRQDFVSGGSGPVTLELLVIMDTDDEQVALNAQISLTQILTTTHGFQPNDLSELYMRLTFVSRGLRERENQLIATVARDGLLIWARAPVPPVLAAVAMRAPLLNPLHGPYDR